MFWLGNESDDDDNQQNPDCSHSYCKHHVLLCDHDYIKQANFFTRCQQQQCRHLFIGINIPYTYIYRVKHLNKHILNYIFLYASPVYRLVANMTAAGAYKNKS